MIITHQWNPELTKTNLDDRNTTCNHNLNLGDYKDIKIDSKEKGTKNEVTQSKIPIGQSYSNCCQESDGRLWSSIWWHMRWKL